MGLLTPIDLSASNGPRKGSKKGSTSQIECLPCESYKTMIDAWQKALKWTEGLDHALSVMLASVASTKSVGDQLWIKVIGCASSGKSTLCEAISVNKEFVFAKSTIRGFHSGYVLDGSQSEDHSLIARLYGKTLVTKDGDTLLQSPNLQQILAEARDIYDGTSRTHYRNAMSKDYEGLRMTWLLCGTSSLRLIDHSELGERFLDCVLMDEIDDELEDEVLLRVADRSDRNLSIESDGEAARQYDPELVTAMRLTGGYVGHLRRNASDALSMIENSKDMRLRCAKLGKFIAFMRARPSYHQEEAAEREFAARLVSQLIRLAKCLALVFNKTDVDDYVMDRVKRVAMDTGRGMTMDMMNYLHDNPEGSGVRSIAVTNNLSSDKVSRLLRFLRQIYAVEQFEGEKVKGVAMSGGVRWRLTRRMRELYEEVTSDG